MWGCRWVTVGDMLQCLWLGRGWPREVKGKKRWQRVKGLCEAANTILVTVSALYMLITAYMLEIGYRLLARGQWMVHEWIGCVSTCGRGVVQQ